MSQAKPSAADNQPELKAAQLQQTLLVLRIAASQLLASLREADDSVRQLGDAFATIAQAEASSAVSQPLQQATAALQFYDALTQRVEHVAQSLQWLESLLADRQQLNSDEAWQQLQQQIRSRYTMEHERQLFDAILAGEDVSQVMRVLQQSLRGARDDVELF
jgi:hypothetical protein